MGNHLKLSLIVFTIGMSVLSACASKPPATTTIEATVAALSTNVAQNSTVIAYLATVVDASKAGTPTPLGFIPTKTPWFTPSPAATSAILVEYSRAGGIAGITSQLRIYANGYATLTQRGVSSEFNLTPAELNKLQSSFRDTNFSSIPENSMPKQLVPDGFLYTVTYANHTVKTADTGIPGNLQSILDALNILIKANGK